MSMNTHTNKTACTNNVQRNYKYLEDAYSLHIGMDIFVWAWHVEVMAFRMEGGQLGGYAVDDNAFLSYIF
jgi:hypothetical protein